MKAQPWHAKAREMRSEKASYEAMSAACGVSKTTLLRFFNPEYAARQQAHVDAYRKRVRAVDPAFSARRQAPTKMWRLRKDAKCEAYDTGRRYEDVCADWGIKP